MTPEQAVNIQKQLTEAHNHLRELGRQREQIFVQLYRQGWTPRNIAKLVGLNHTPVYRALERGGYEPRKSFREQHLLRDMQRAVVAKAKMATSAKQTP